MKKHLVLLVFILTFSISQSISAQINTAAGGAGSVLANSPTSNTNVGIGTNAPKSKLDVEGGVSIGTTYSGTTASPTNGAIIEGNVGIGTNAPANRLHITSATAGTSGLRFTNLISTTATTSGLLGKALSVNASGDVVLVPVANTDTSLFLANGALASARTVTMSGFGLTFNPSTANSQFFINGTNGNTGIGNITPTTRLEVTSGTAGDSGVKLTNLLSTSTAAAANGKALSVDATGKVILVPVPASASGIDANATLTASRTMNMAGLNYTFNPSTANSQFFINGTSGNVGVGTINPISQLHIEKSVDESQLLRMSNNANNYFYSGIDGLGLYFEQVSDTPAKSQIRLQSRNSNAGDYTQFFLDGGNARFSFMNGNVGIGTATPIGKLDVTGGLANGQTFTDVIDSYLKSCILNIGSIRSPSLGTRLLTFFDIPSSNMNPKAEVVLKIEDRADRNRFKFNAETGGTTNFEMNTRDQLNAFRVIEDGNDNVTMTLPKINSKVGIGTATPTEKLDVAGNVKATKAIFPGSELSNQTYTNYDNAIDSSIVFSAGKTNPLFPNRRLLNFYDMSMTSPFVVNAVGLSMSDRAGKGRFSVDLYEGSGTDFTLWDKDQSEFFKVKDYGNGTQGPYMQIPKPNSRVIIGGWANDAIIGTHSFVVKGSSLIQGNILTDSNIGIGTSSFLDAADSKTYKLSVKGRIRAEEVKVYNTWADYVFNKEYNLRSLNDLEAYIKANGHLPNVPSAKEVTEKGLELGEMTKIQQEKIEELTLYLIQQNKEIQELKAQMKVLMEKK